MRKPSQAGAVVFSKAEKPSGGKTTNFRCKRQDALISVENN
jgi:hypothetical protein